MIDRTKMTIHGLVLTVPHNSLAELLDFAVMSQFQQFSLANENGWTLSAPLDARQQVAYTWLFHKQKGLEKPPEPPKGGPKPPSGPTPPEGGTPGAGQQYEEPELLLAVA